MSSGTLAERAAAQRQLAASPRVLQSLAVGRALAHVIDSDMAIFREANLGRRPHPGEELAELDGDLASILLRAYDFRDPEITRALVFGAYVPLSEFSLEAGEQGATVLPDALSLARDPINLWRAQAIGIFGFMLMRRREGRLKFPISAAQAAAVHAQLRAFARSSDFHERYTAVQALGIGGNADDLPLLRHVAATDPSCARFPKAITICELALKAIQKIEARAQRGPGAVR